MRRIITFIKDKFADFKASIKRTQIKMKTNLKEDFTPNNQLTDEQREAKRMRSISRITTGIMAATMAMSCMGITCFAADGASSEGVETFNTVVEFIVDWVARIGLVIGFIGAVQFAMGFKEIPPTVRQEVLCALLQDSSYLLLQRLTICLRYKPFGKIPCLCRGSSFNISERS